MNDYFIVKVMPTQGYELLDSGDGEKLERYGEFIVARPDPQALWPKLLTEAVWKEADAIFSRDSKNTGWKLSKSLPEKWAIDFGGMKFWIKPTSFKHTGLFPEQQSNWGWIQDKIKNRICHSDITGGISGSSVNGERSLVAARLARDDSSNRSVRVLNLFGYTGGASLAAAQAGAEVVHVDGSKSAITWARENAEISGLSAKPVRWILDDAAAFVRREIKRGNKYEGIIMDPPAFGHGPNGEMWKIEESFLPFLDMCRQILSDQPLFFLLNGYASGYSAIAYKNNLDELVKKYGGNVEMGELTIEEKESKRLLPCGIFARWHS